MPFTIVNVKPFDLPHGYQDNPFLLIAGVALMLVASAALIVLYVIENMDYHFDHVQLPPEWQNSFIMVFGKQKRGLAE